MDIFGEEDKWAGSGPITPLFRTYGELSPTAPTPAFAQQIMTVLYGEPDLAKHKFRAFDFIRDPAMLGRLGMAVLCSFPKGVDDFIATLTESLKLYNAASRGYVAALLEKPTQPGTVSANNPLIKYLAERGEIEGLIALGKYLRALDNTDILTALNTSNLRVNVGQG